MIRWIIAGLIAMLVAACTLTLSISKGNTSSPQSVEQSGHVSADSAGVSVGVR